MTETISRGAQFKGVISLLGLIVFVFSLIVGIAMLVHLHFEAGFVLIMIATCAFSLFLDVRGTQFDLHAKKVRAYKQFLWVKYGEWLDLDRFHEVHLGKDTFHVMTYGGPLTGSRAKVVSFDVVLIAHAKENSILLSEFSNQDDGVAFMNSIAQKLSLPARNIYRELQQSAVSRRTSRR